jgi:enoyl reductase-like protein
MSLRGYNRGGRPLGSRNRINKQFLDDFLAEWQEGGRKAIKIMRIQHPGDFVRVAASLLPKEFVVENVLTEIDDGELERMITRLRAEVLAGC